MLFFPSELGNQLLKSLTIDQAKWKWDFPQLRFKNPHLDIDLEFHKSLDIYRLFIKGNDCLGTLTWYDRYRLRKFYRKMLTKHTTIPNSIDNPEEFI